MSFCFPARFGAIRPLDRSRPETPSFSLVRLTAVFALVAFSLCSVRAETVVKANNTDSLNLPTSWTGNASPSSSDLVLWDATVTSSKIVALGGDQHWLGFHIANPVGSITLNAGNTLTLGISGIVSEPNLAITLNNAIALGAAQTWSVGANTFIAGGGVNTAGFALELDGAGIKQFKKNITGGGAIRVSGGQLKLSGSSTATDSAVTVESGATLAFDTANGAAPAARTNSITLNAGTLTASGLSGTSSVETNTNALTIGPGRSTVTITPNAATNTRLTSGSFVRQPGGVVLFRGTDLGDNPADSPAAGSANITFLTAPPLSGTGLPGTPSAGILPGALGDIITSGNGASLLTYDASKGVRALDSTTEVVASIPGGQNTPNNIALSNTSGTQLTGTINAPTTINSLSLIVSTATGSGITLSGTGVLKISSGVIWGYESIATATAADAMVITDIPLDLNGREGIILFSTRNLGSGGTGGGPLELRTRITNDGGNGVTFSGSGLVKLSGSTANTYTGTTTHLSGNLHLAKSGTTSIPGNLVLRGGTIINAGNQIPDTTDIFIHGGSLAQKASLNSGSGASETFRDLIMTGGNLSSGAAGTSSGSTLMRNASLTNYCTWNVSGGHKATISGSFSLADGGTVTISGASSSSHSTILYVNGGLYISNAPSGSHTPITINSSSVSTNAGGQLALSCGVTFVPHPANTNTVTINSPVPVDTGRYGTISLSGAQIFHIADGPAPDDVTIAAPLTDGTSVGGLIKTGPGTLVLTRDNSLTGAIIVNSGTLRLDGTSAVDIQANNAGIAFSSDLLSPGNLTLNNATRVVLDHTVSFRACTINGTALSPGIYSFTALSTSWPGLFTGSANDSAIIVQGATWYLGSDQTAGADWNSPPGGNWSYNANGTGTQPFTINPYDIFHLNGHLLRTSTTSSTFAGGALELSPGSTLSLQTASGETSTIPYAISSGGTIAGLVGSGTIQYLVIGDFELLSGTTTFSAGAGSGIALNVDFMSGAGHIQFTGGGTFLPDFTDASSYAGTITLQSGTLSFPMPATGNPLSSAGALVIANGAKAVFNTWTYFTALTTSGSSRAPGTYTAASLGFSGSGGVVVYNKATTAPPQMFGVNLAGGEFGNTVPGTYGSDYIYPSDAELAYYQAKGLRLIRLPFKWERVQRSLNATLHAAEMTRLDTVVGYARNRGMKLILDMHNYNKYSISGTGHQVGTTQVPYSALQNVWSQIADRYKNEPAIYGYDIMNEPGGTLENWNAAAQAAVHAIRLKDTTHYVFIEGISFSGAQSWLSQNAELNVIDPVGRIIYSAHSYWDKTYQNFSTNWKYDGTYASYTQEGGYPEMGADLMADFFGWLRERGHYGHIGEFGVPGNDSRWTTVLDKGLAAMQNNNVSATYWSGGLWWGTYPLSCEPTNNFTTDAPQMAALEKYTGSTFASWKSGYFNDADLADPTITGPLANPPGDGISNFLSYGFGYNPTAFKGAAYLPQITTSGGYLTLTYPRNRTAQDLTYVVEVSNNLQTWTSGTAYTATPVILSDDGFQQTIQVKDKLPLSSGTSRYIRLRITSP